MSMAAFADRDGRRGRWGTSLRRLVRFAESVADPVQVQDPVVSPPTSATEPRWLGEVENRAEELGKLGRNWDGRGSAAVSRDSLEFARSILAEVMAPTTIAPSIIPLGHGGIQLEWVSRDVEIEVEIVKPYDVVIYHLDRPRGVEREWTAEAEFSELARILRASFTP